VLPNNEPLRGGGWLPAAEARLDQPGYPRIEFVTGRRAAGGQADSNSRSAGEFAGRRVRPATFDGFGRRAAAENSAGGRLRAFAFTPHDEFGPRSHVRAPGTHERPRARPHL
jgi:hypothetical protein